MDESRCRGHHQIHTRLPVHVLARKLGRELCEVLPAVHALTGCDITSKFGTKAAALKSKPSSTPKRIREELKQFCVWMKLNCIWYKSWNVVTIIYKLWLNCDHHSKSVTILDLPPTSHATTGHIIRAFYSTYNQINCLSALTLNPTDFGFELVDGLLVPDRFYLPLPDDVAIVCTCVKCSTTRCVCRQTDAKCCEFCKCQTEQVKNCCNPNGIIRTQ